MIDVLEVKVKILFHRSSIFFLDLDAYVTWSHLFELTIILIIFEII